MVRLDPGHCTELEAGFSLPDYISPQRIFLSLITRRMFFSAKERNYYFLDTRKNTLNAKHKVGKLRRFIILLNRDELRGHWSLRRHAVTAC